MKLRAWKKGAGGLMPPILILLACAGCHRRQKPNIKVTTITGESAFLPRAVEPPGEVSFNAAPKTLQVQGRTRGYLLITPNTPTPGPRPLVLVYHGDGGTMTDLHDEWKWENATRNDAFVVYPDGINRAWDLETKAGNKDIDFTTALIDELAKTLPIDRTRVFATGYSSGGFFVNVLACHRPDLLRGIASNAGGAPYNQDEAWPNKYPKCPGQKPVAALALHGDRDFSVGLDSGRFSAEYWAYVNGCSETEVETTGYAECTVYRGCKKPVGWCPISGLSHWVWTESAFVSWSFFQQL